MSGIRVKRPLKKRLTLGQRRRREERINRRWLARRTKG